MKPKSNTAFSSRPIISVVIPTRDRPETLRSCLAALAHHRSSLIEIVVQDNYSRPETRKIVNEAKKRDPRVRYSRAPFSTSQRHNFELGLAAATGDYLTIIGDDDGFCLGSLDWLIERLQENPADAVRWKLIHYVWPSLSTDGEGFIRVYASHCYGGWRYGSSKQIAASTLLAQNIGSWDNVLVYHGMISRELYNRMRAKTKGVFFPYPMPDVYAHNLIAFQCNKLLQVDNPVSIYGTSGHSAGVSWSRVITNIADDDGAAAGQKWISESRNDPVANKVHWQPNIRTLRYHDMRALEVAKDHGLLPADATVDRNVWTNAILEEIKKQPWSLGPWLTAEPLAPYDGELFRIVRQHFTHLVGKAPKPPSAKYEPDYPETLVRIRHLNQGFNDDVEGAMLAIEVAMDDGGPVYKVQSQTRTDQHLFQADGGTLPPEAHDYHDEPRLPGMASVSGQQGARRGPPQSVAPSVSHHPDRRSLTARSPRLRPMPWWRRSRTTSRPSRREPATPP